MAVGDATVKIKVEWDESTRTLIDALRAVVVIGPDDHLVLVFRHLYRLQLDQLRTELRERYPTLADRVVIAGGEVEVAAVRGARPYGTSGGVPLTGELIERLNAEAERGYDTSRLKSREEQD